jgi:hypothetical protein
MFESERTTHHAPAPATKTPMIEDLGPPFESEMTAVLEYASQVPTTTTPKRNMGEVLRSRCERTSVSKSRS